MDLKLRSEDQDYKVAFAIEQYGNYPLYFKKTQTSINHLGTKRPKIKVNLNRAPNTLMKYFPFHI